MRVDLFDCRVFCLLIQRITTIAITAIATTIPKGKARPIAGVTTEKVPVTDNLGYWLWVNSDCLGVFTTGTRPDNCMVYLAAGWNLVHFPLTSANTTPSNLFADSSYTMDYWIAPNGPYNEPNYSAPVEDNRGYWIWIDQDWTVIVP